MERISSSGEDGLSAEETELIRALVLTEPAVGLLFVDFGDEVWKSSGIKMSHAGQGEKLSNRAFLGVACHCKLFCQVI